MEKIWNKLKTGLRDYCKESGFHKVILGLSGGLDSAIVSVLAAEVLGGENVKALMMKTKYTSRLSVDIARELAMLNHLDYHEIDIQPIVDNQFDFLYKTWGEKPKNIVLENLQARERGKLLMAFSNQFGGLVLCCGNKSEAVMGYCTLYGDTCGGLAPLANMYKSDLFELAKWRNQKNRVFPSEVLVRAPSAELSLGQKDEDSLPPYPLLDKVLKAFIDEGKNINEIVDKGYDKVLVSRILTQYEKMAFKRKQMPPFLDI